MPSTSAPSPSSQVLLFALHKPSTPHTPQDTTSTLFPKPPASRSPSPHSTIHSLSVISPPPRLQNNPRTQILCIGSRRAAAELRPSATQPLRGNHNAAERLQRAHRRGRYGDAAPTPSALPSLLLVACVFSVRTSAEPPLALWVFPASIWPGRRQSPRPPTAAFTNNWKPSPLGRGWIFLKCGRS